jgi:hypothetical protein
MRLCVHRPPCYASVASPEVRGSTRAVPDRCNYLDQYKGYDCPGYWLPDGGSASADPTKKGAGFFPAGNPFAGEGGGGGVGCHFDHDHPTQGIDQTDAYDAARNNIVQDSTCQCNYNLKANGWHNWVEQWLAGATPKKGEEWQYWFGGGKAPSYALDYAACWMNNPRDMIQLQNALWTSRFDWSNQEIPRSSWDQQPGSASQRVYWGWNEVPVARSVVDDSQNWDAIFIKLPAAVCNGASEDSVRCLSHDTQWTLETNLDDFVKGGLLKPGVENARSRPGSAVVFLKEQFVHGAWARSFYCEGFSGPQRKWDVVYDSARDVCFIDAAKPSPPQPPTPHATWHQSRNTNCYLNHGAIDLESPTGSSAGAMNVSACKNYCLTQPSPKGACTAIAYDNTQGLCYRRGSVQLKMCEQVDGYDTWTVSS